MANTNVTMRIDETLKSQLQELMSNLGLDMTTFFTMAAKQAVREQALPFHPDMNSGIYGMQAYKLAMKNTNYNNTGKATVSSADEWNDETEWDDIFEQMKKNSYVCPEPELMLFTIIELVGSTCYSCILYGQPVSVEEYLPYLHTVIRQILAGFIVQQPAQIETKNAS